MRAVIFLLLIITTNPLFSQSVTVLNKETNKPIEDVFIFDLTGEKTAKSDKEGKFDVSSLRGSQIVTFQHPSYYSVSITYEELAQVSKVFLTEQILQMNELVVSANKWEQSTADIPNTIAVIQPKDIEFQNPQTTADILDQSGKVFIQKSQGGGGSPMIRGFSANSLLIVVDGVRMNNAIFRSGNLQNIISIDPLTLESTEVIFGPGSVIYGSDALGGVMDFHTINPNFSETSETEITAFSRYSSANNERSGHLSFTRTGNKLSFLTGWSYNVYDDLRTGSKRTDEFPSFGLRPSFQQRINDTDQLVINNDPNLQIQSGYSQWNGLTKLRYKISDTRNITYGFYFSNTTDIPRYDRLIRFDNGQPRSAQWNYGPQKWIRNSIQYNDFVGSGIYDAMKFTLAMQSFTESRHTRDFGDPLMINRTENVDVYSLNLDLDKNLSEKSKLFYGIEFILNNVESSAFAQDIETSQITDASTRYPDGGSIYQTSAIYGNYTRDISEKVIFNAGGRINQVNLQSEFDNKAFFDFPFDDLTISKLALNGNLGLVVKPNSSWKIDFLLSTGFRAPNVDDAGKLFDSEPGNIIVPNPDLEPEKAYNVDLGISKIFGEQVKVDVTGFYTIVDDIITRRDALFNGEDSILYDGVLSRVQSLENVEGGYILGASIYFKAAISKHVSLTSTLTYTDGEDADGFPIRHASPAFGRTSLQYEKGMWTIDLFSVYNGALAFEDLAPSEQNKNHIYTSDGSLAWTTFNFKLAVRPTRGLSLFAGLENIFDIHYRPYSSGISAPGRNFIFSAKYSF